MRDGASRTIPHGSMFMVKPQRFTTTVQALSRGRAFVAVPFDPDQVWAVKPHHHVTGTINGQRVRAVVETHGQERGFVLGQAWLRDCQDVAVGQPAEVEIRPEGPQRGDLDEDIAAALESSPAAGSFFDSLAQFYRKAYLRWIDGTKSRPAERTRRIAEMIALLDKGIKQRPK